MQINPNIFRAYDIRGTADPIEGKPEPDLTPDTVRTIGQGVGTYLQRKDSAKHMIVGRDNRLHSEKLQTAFIEGIRSTGIDVLNLGLSASPLLYWAVCHYHTDSGVNITASHNPKHDNGIKIVRKEAHSVANEELQDILKIIQSEDFITAEKPGLLEDKSDFFPAFLSEIAEKVKLERPLKVVVDTGNAVTGCFAPQMLRHIGCEVIELYTELDGTFPNHEANPEQEHLLEDLKAKVLETGADLGIGFDGDGDRIGIIGENGRFYSAEYPLILLARDLLAQHPGEKIVFDVKVSQILPKDIKQHGGNPEMFRTGHSFIEEKLRHEKATLAGEKSGHIYLGPRHFKWYGFDDALFTSCKLVEILSKSDKTWSEHFASLPVLHSTAEIKLPCPDQHKFRIVDELKALFCSTHDCITIDGARILFDIDSWALVRCSNTSPYLTVLFEAPTAARLEEIRTSVYAEIRKHPEVEIPA